MALFQVNFFSHCLRRPTPLNVIIPCDNFGPFAGGSKCGPYRTLYLLHGYSGNRMDWLLSGDAQETASKYNIAIVMPSGDNSFYTDNPYYNIWYSEFIGHELVEYTRKIFPLSDKREDTYIGGLSMGGFGTLLNAIRHCDVFGHAIALSAPFIDTFLKVKKEPDFMGIMQSYYDVLFGSFENLSETDANIAALAEKAVKDGKELPELYIACGYNDMLVHGNRDMHKKLLELGIPHCYEEGPGTHEWPFWREYLCRGLEKSISAPAKGKHPFWIERDEEGVI